MKAQRSTFSCVCARRHSMNSRRFLLSLIPACAVALNSKFILSQNTSQTKLLRQRSICNTSCYVIHSERQGSPWRACQHAYYRSSVVMTRVSEAPAEGEVLQQHSRPHTHGHAPGASPRPRASGQHNSPQASPRCAGSMHCMARLGCGMELTVSAGCTGIWFRAGRCSTRCARHTPASRSQSKRMAVTKTKTRSGQMQVRHSRSSSCSTSAGYRRSS